MSKPPSFRTTIATIREAITIPPPKKGSDSRLYLAIYDLGRRVPEIIANETLHENGYWEVLHEQSILAVKDEMTKDPGGYEQPVRK